MSTQVNIGVAVAGEEGLVVPVVRRADEKSLSEINSEIRRFRHRAAAMRFEPDELSGSTFTISNLGMFGIDRFRAILNPPESAILAVGRIVKRPVGLADGSVALCPMMSMTLTVDHRVLDGFQAARFLADLRERIEVPHHVAPEADE
jgi:pyruvate dehydrogenase E2 component (dihydrolipoamide acetyltransferase)